MPVKQSKAKASLAHGQTPIKKKKHASPITKKIKKVQQYTNWVDSASTKVEDVTVHWITKFNSKEAAFINHHKKHFQEAGQESFPTLFAIMGRRDSNEAPLNRYLKAQPGTSFYWECLVAERNDNDTASTLGRRIAKEFTEGLAAAAKAMIVGSGFDDGSMLGPVISREQRDRIERLMATAEQEGARLLCGARRPRGSHGTPAGCRHSRHGP